MYHVKEMWIYPIKSMQGMSVSHASCGEKGLFGDRQYALQKVDTGHIASAKYPPKWKKLPSCKASYESVPLVNKPDPLVTITFPDGRVVQNDDPHIDDIFSDFLDREVRLISQVPSSPTIQADRSPAEEKTNTVIRDEAMGTASTKDTFFDHAPVHVITTSTLETLSSLQTGSFFNSRRFRPNIVLLTEGANEMFPENFWPGQNMLIYPDITLKIVDPTPRCVVTTLPQGELSYDRQILRTIAKHSQAVSATFAPKSMLPATSDVYAQAITPGQICVGAQVSLSLSS